MTTETTTLARIDSITLGAADPEASARFYRDAFDLDGRVRTTMTDAATDGFRGYTVSLVASQPANVTALFDAAVAAGAAILKPLAKSLWGFGGVVQAPDGAIWNLATSGGEFRRAVVEAARAARPGAGLFVFTFSRHTLPPDAQPVAGESFVFTQFSGQPQVFLTEGQLVEELASAGFARDASIPLAEYNRRDAQALAGGPPVIYEAVFRRA